MGGYVLDLAAIDRTQITVVGGKGASLGELARLGVPVPPGFCVTTDAFRRALAGAPGFDHRLDRLARLDPEDGDALRRGAAELRGIVAAAAVPDDVATAVTDAVARLGGDTPCAVRSSATAEDLPTASSAGQQDSYLNVVG